MLEIVHMFEQVSGKRVPLDMRPRRPGDVAICLSDPGSARKELNRQATQGLEEMLCDAWRWHVQNPQGYETQKAGSEV